MKKKLQILLIVVFGFVDLPILDADNINFSQISTKNGLSQNTVRAITIDKNGFIWSGTLDGLNRYDGYNIRSYQPENALSDHRIRDLYVSSNGNLWVKTYKNEFSCYNPVADTFTHIEDETGKLLTYTNFNESSKGKIWIWGPTDGAICIQEKQNKKFDKTVYSSPSEGCSFFKEDSSGNIWIGTRKGLKKITKQGAVQIYYNDKYSFTHAIEIDKKIFFSTLESTLIIYNMQQNSFEEIVTTFGDPLISLYRFSAKELLVLTETQRLWIYNIPENKFYLSDLNNDIDYTKGEIWFVRDKQNAVWFYNQSGVLWYCNGIDSKIRKMSLLTTDVAVLIKSMHHSFAIDNIFLDSKGIFWIATYGYGLYCYNPKSEKLTNYTNQSNQHSLPSNYLLSIAEDRFGNIWIGSEYAGLIRVVKNPDYVHIMRPEINNIVGKTNNVRSICEDSNGNIWIGLKNGSLYVYNSMITEGRCIAENLNPYALVEDGQRRMWVGSKGGGIYLFDINTFKKINYFTHKDNDPTSLHDKEIFHLIKDNKERIWVASFKGGISVIIENEKGKNFIFRNFLSDKGNQSMFRYLLQDREGMIWAGSSDGLIKFDPDKLIQNPDAYTSYKMNPNQLNSLSSNDIKTIFQDREGVIWIGTAGGGLNKYVKATKKNPEHFQSFVINKGMPENYVVGMLEYNGYLWLSSEGGLSRFNKTDYSVVTFQFAQNIYGNIFNEGAAFKRKNGTMLWGSLDGLMMFDPQKFKPDTLTPRALITGLQIDEIDWRNIDPLLKNKSITYTDNIKLSNKQNVFTIEFATLDLRNPEKNCYTYILENYDRAWSTPSHSNIATYKNLPPGKYIFKVKGTNSFGIWNEEYTSLEITITPPIWKSSIAYVLYSLMILLLFYIVFRLIIKFNRLNNAIEIEKQLTNHKLRFFTNISHEFRTPLTLIQGAVENMSELHSLPEAAYKQLAVLNRNSLNLRRLIDQLLEFRKLQNDVLKLDLEEIDIVDFSYNIYTGFRELAERRAINYLFTNAVESLFLLVDRKKLDKVIYNLLSNAFKYTPKEGTIEVLLTEEQSAQKCVIAIIDSGIGVSKDKQHLLFSRFSQINYSDSGTGIGLSLVKEFVEVHKGKVYFEDNVGGGSIFKIELSTDKNIYTGENLLTDKKDSDIIESYPDTKHFIYQSILEPIETINSSIIENYRLLIIDDNDDIRNFLMDGFRDRLSVDSAVDGKDGLHKAIETNPDIIICDVMMPEMDGFEVTRQLKQEFQTCHIPIILVTAHSSIEHQLEGIDSGADAYITKPFSLKYVQKRVIKLIEQRELLKKRFSKDFVIDETLINTTEEDKTFYEKIEKILDNNYHNSLFTIEKFVELSGYGRTTFFKKVKGITGFAPNELIKIKRLTESAILLKNSGFNVSEISYKVGFEDPFYFSKCFKIHFNCTPSQYKKGRVDI